jgi:hypothetical protein
VDPAGPVSGWASREAIRPKWDISDPALAEELTSGDQVVCEYVCGNEVGYGITEFLIVGQYPRYGF